MPVYRYRLNGPNQTDLQGAVAGSPTVGTLQPQPYVDITLSNAAYKTDLDEYMAGRGYTYDSQDPATTASQQQAANNLSRISFYNNGTLLSKRSSMNFVGLVALSDDAVNDRVTFNLTLVNPGTPTMVDAGDAGIIGGATGALAWSDHQHPVNTAAAANLSISDASAASAGTSNTIPRGDHKHQVSTGTPVALGAALAEGTASTLARSDHVHIHGNQAGGNLHYNATSGYAGFMAPEDKTKIDAIKSFAFNNVLVVDPTNTLANYATIQAAINAAPSGTVIFIAPGTYNETLTLKAGIALVGMTHGSGYGAVGVTAVTVSYSSTGTSTTLITNPAGNGYCFIQNIAFNLTVSGGAGTHKLLSLVNTNVAINLVFIDCNLILRNTYNGSGGTFQLFDNSSGSSGAEFYECKISASETFMQGTWNASTITANWTFQNTVVQGSSRAALSISAGSLTLTNSTMGTITRTGGSVYLYGINYLVTSTDADDGSGTNDFTKYTYGVMRTDGSQKAQKIPLRSLTADPTSPANGEIWYNSTTGKFRVYENGAAKDMVGGGGTAGGANTQIQYNSSGAFAGDPDFTFDASLGEMYLNGDIRLNGLASVPATPAAGTLKLFAQNLGGRMMPRVIGPSGIDYSLQASLAGQGVSIWFPTTGAAVGSIGVGLANTGTLTTPALATTNLFTQTRRTRFATTATAGASAGTRATDAHLWRGNAAGLGGFFFLARFGTSTTVAQQRSFVGVYGSAAVIGNVNPSTLLNIVGMGYDSTQTSWRIMYNDGTGTASSIDLGTTNFPVNTTNLYSLYLFCAPNSTSINYMAVNETTNVASSGTLSTDLPANTTFLIEQAWTNNGTTASAAQLDLVRMYSETDF